jgi:hypothetical protein
VNGDVMKWLYKAIKLGRSSFISATVLLVTAKYNSARIEEGS